MATKIKIFSIRYEPEQKTVSGIFILYRNTNKLIFFLEIKRDECFNIFNMQYYLIYIKEKKKKKKRKKDEIFVKTNYLRNTTLCTRI